MTATRYPAATLAAGSRLATVPNERAQSGQGRVGDDLHGPQPAEAGTGRPLRPLIRPQQLRTRTLYLDFKFPYSDRLLAAHSEELTERLRGARAR